MYFLHAINSDRQARLLNVLGQIAMILGDKIKISYFWRGFIVIGTLQLRFCFLVFDLLLQGFVLCNISCGKGSNFMDLFRLRTRNRTLVANHQIIPNPTLSLLEHCLSSRVPRKPGIRCFTITGSVTHFRWHFSQLAFQTSCSLTYTQLATYSNVIAAQISERIPWKMLKRGAFLLTAELGATPMC